MDSLFSMRVFCTVAELRSFSAAAGVLALSPAMVSKHVAHLERRLGARLLHRNSRNVSLSETGAAYLEQVTRMLDELQEVETNVALATAKPSGLLRVSAPAWMANPSFARLLAEFHSDYSEIQVEVDFSGRLVNLVDEGFDLALRVSGRLDPGLVAKRLADIRFDLVGAAAYLDRAGRPRSMSDLNGHALLAYSTIPVGGLFDFREPKVSIRFNSVMRSSNEIFLRMAALEGLGLTFLPTCLTQDDVASGRLEAVLPGAASFTQTCYYVYPSRRYLSAKIRAFLDFLARHPAVRTGLAIDPV